MYLLTTFAHDSKLQAITAPPLISTFNKSPQHPLRLFQPAVSSPALATASNGGDSSAWRVQVLSSQPPLQNCLTTRSQNYVTTDGQSASLSWNHTLIWCCLTTDFVPPLQHLGTDHIETPRFQQKPYCFMRIRCSGDVFTEPFPRNGRCYRVDA
jgi:hypothetical protein